ncbi:hypothetical protein ACWCRD_15060 [Streptomyces sp. NPDC002092]
MPKAHLHLHLEGAMRPAMLVELAGERGDQVPDTGGDFASFEDFAPLYSAAARLVREGPRENLLRLAREVVEDAAADGAVRAEPHVNPLTRVGVRGRRRETHLQGYPHERPSGHPQDERIQCARRQPGW